jgi:NADP-dependent 3-hydroxy acid dehydrogenase YdfG/acyl carrier protein
LVHAAAGGVGMAAMQLARWIGAEVLATASPPKWEVLRSLGVKHIASSRDSDFVSAFRSATGGADVVLNSLTGEFIDASLSLLTPGGRFVEIGKADIRDEASVGARHPGVIYRAFDVFSIPPERIATMFAAVVDGFASGHLKPLPMQAFAMTDAEAAFRFMAQARHVGKLAVVVARETLRTEGTALVTGGLGALGLEVARDFARRGMRHLVLTGRRGMATPGASEAVAELEALGARVTVAEVDVADRKALARTIGSIPSSLPLRAVVHAAVILDDGMITDQTPERFRKVMAPKVSGAWNLHALIERADLDAFVLFSSMVGTFGNASQAAYSAANACLDALAVHRRAQGLPAISLGWGPWAEVGRAAGLNAKLQARFTGQGFAMLPPEQGMVLFDSVISRREPHLVVAPIDLRAAARSFGSSVPPLWRALVRAPRAPAVAADGGSAKQLAALLREGNLEAVTLAVRAEVARVLSMGTAAGVPADRPLRELGLDSLMAVELRNALGRRAKATLPANLAFEHPTPEAIAKYMLSEVAGVAGEAAGEESSPETTNGGLARVVSRPTPDLAVEASWAPEPFTVSSMGARPGDQIDTIPMGERWLSDGFRVIPAAGGYAQRMVDMTQATRALRLLGEAGFRGTFTHVFVRAAALALARNPRLHQTVIGYRKLTPGSVDIGLSMAGQTTYAPVVVLPGMDRTPLPAVVGIVEDATAISRVKEERDLQNLRRTGWITPFGFFRRFVIRVLQKMFWFRRRLVGTFQVTGVPTVDAAIPLQFYAGSILAFGRVRDAVVAVDGRVEVRPMVSLAVCVDHVSRDSLRGATLLGEIANILESEELVDEARDAAAGDSGSIQGTKALEEPQPAALPPASAE